MDHSASVFMVDGDGRVVGTIDHRDQEAAVGESFSISCIPRQDDPIRPLSEYSGEVGTGSPIRICANQRI